MKLIEKIGKEWRHRRARREVKRKSKHWVFPNGYECGEQGEGALGTQELLKIERMRRKLGKDQLERCAEAKKETRLRNAVREAKCPKSL